MSKQNIKPYINITEPKRIHQRWVLSLTGFSLIELIIVIVIVGILAAIAIPMYSNVVEKEKYNACITNMRMILTAWRIYDTQYPGTYPPATGWQNTAGAGGINDTLGTRITEINFGRSGAAGSDQFYMRYYTIGLYLPRYRILAYRQQPTGNYYNQWVRCDYYPNGNASGIRYDWTNSVGWPASWLPADE